MKTPVLVSLFETRHQQWCFSVNTAKLLRTTIIKNICNGSFCFPSHRKQSLICIIWSMQSQLFPGDGKPTMTLSDKDSKLFGDSASNALKMLKTRLGHFSINRHWCQNILLAALWLTIHILNLISYFLLQNYISLYCQSKPIKKHFWDFCILIIKWTTK